MRRRSLPAIISSIATIAIVASLPNAAFAGRQFSTLQKDVSLFQSILDGEAKDGSLESADAAHDSVKDLFADVTASGSAKREVIQTDPFVSFRENGIPYQLKDVPRQAWFAPYVRDMVERKIVSGYRDLNGIPTGFFSPENNVAVDELAKMTVSAAGVDVSICTGQPRNPIASTGSWARSFDICAEKLGWALYGDGTVDLHRPATRAEVIMTILQAFDVPLRQASGSGTIFSDVGPATQFAPAIQTAALDGIVSGYADDPSQKPKFGPANPINRAEVAKMLSMALQLYRH